MPLFWAGRRCAMSSWSMGNRQKGNFNRHGFFKGTNGRAVGVWTADRRRAVGSARRRWRLDVRSSPWDLAGSADAGSHIAQRGQATACIGSGKDQGAPADADGRAHAEQRRNREQGAKSRGVESQCSAAARRRRRPAAVPEYMAAARMVARFWACESPFRLIATPREPSQDMVAGRRARSRATRRASAENTVLPLSNSTPLSRRLLAAFLAPH